MFAHSASSTAVNTHLNLLHVLTRMSAGTYYTSPHRQKKDNLNCVDAFQQLATACLQLEQKTGKWSHINLRMAQRITYVQLNSVFQC